ncbi:hypothetical protein TTHERM_00444200 (macronuclear) [Tetrahymena thermophila SB210]|uniref:Uncharacterized protein n=1 Tax=Tetrahymena thermophila (strain SB210) TaxID=312017 RepID=I7LWX5_TETTS|nr:hypothetical protein TTHERM_00444200 [Tetrahymena thermophila SB210]EAS03037.2 hypothetical protein TTHERM_00444200 [Tetrahymena thermophila SB210]|eukprot:XP_001023282.2 hypothetical protein TTHERM_00444200 [Tetrahymena thermophila SB210]
MNQINTPIKNIRGYSTGSLPPQQYQTSQQANINFDTQSYSQQNHQNQAPTNQFQQQQNQQRGSSGQKYLNSNIPTYQPQISQVPTQSYLIQNGQSSSSSNFSLISPAKARNSSIEGGNSYSVGTNIQPMTIQAQIQQKQVRNIQTPTKQRYIVCNPQIQNSGGNQQVISNNQNQINGIYNYSIQQKTNGLQNSNSKSNQIGINNRSIQNNNNSNNNINNISGNGLNNSGYGLQPSNAGNNINAKGNNLQVTPGIQQSALTYSINGNLAQILTVAGANQNAKVPTIIQQNAKQQVGLLKPIHHQVIVQSPTKENTQLKSSSLPKHNNQFSLINNILENSINNNSTNQLSQNGVNSAKKLSNVQQQLKQQQLSQQQNINTNSSATYLNSNNSVFGPSPQKGRPEQSDQPNQQQTVCLGKNNTNGGQVHQGSLQVNKQQVPQVLQNHLVSKLNMPNNYHIQPIHKSLSIHQDQRVLISQNPLPIAQNVQTPSLSNNLLNQKTLEASLKEANQEKELLREKLVKQESDLQNLTQENEKLNQLVQQFLGEKKQNEDNTTNRNQEIEQDFAENQDKIKKTSNKNQQNDDTVEEDGVNFGSSSDAQEVEKILLENKQLQEMVSVLEKRINQIIAQKEEEYEGKRDSEFNSNQEELHLVQLENEDLRKKIGILIETNEKNMQYYPEVIAEQENKLKVLAEENFSLNQVIRNKVEEIDQIHAKYSHELQKIKQTDREGKDLTQSLQQLKQQLEDLQKNYSLVIQERDQLKNEKENIEFQFDQNKIELVNVQDSINQYENKLKQTNEEKEKIFNDYNIRAQEIEHYKEEQGNLLQQLENMNQILVNRSNELQMVQEQNQLQEGNVLELTRQLEILINENEKLNNFIQSQNKDDPSYQSLQAMLEDKDQFIGELEKQINDLQNQKHLESTDYEIIIQEQKDILKELEEKIQLLVQENDKLNQIIQNQQLTQNDFQVIADMETKVQELAEENQKLLTTVEKYKQEAELWKRQVMQQASQSTSSTSLPPQPPQNPYQNGVHTIQQQQLVQQQNIKQITNSSPISSNANQQLNWQTIQQQQQQQHSDLSSSWHNQSSQYFNSQSEQQLPSSQYLQVQQQPQQQSQQQQQLQQISQQQQQIQQIPQFGQINPQPQINLTQKRFPSAGKSYQQQQFS